jgi:hypothetical protein
MPTHPQGHPPEYLLQVRMHPDKSPTDGSQIVPTTGGAGRAASVVQAIESLMDDEMIAEGARCIREAMRATIWVRGTPMSREGAAAGHRFGYVETPDHASRLAATRLALAYRFGNPVSASEIRLLRAPTDAPAELSPEEKLRELRATGIDLEHVVKSWMRSIDNVTPPENLPKIAQDEPTAPLADAFLDV